MSELPELPPHSPALRLPPPGGLERAVTEGRRRRTRFLGGTAAGSTLAVVLLAAVLATPAQRDDSLRVATPQPRPTTSAGQEQPEPEEAPEPAQTPSPDSGGEAEPRGEPEPEPSAAPPPPGEPEPGAAPAPEPPPLDQRPLYTEKTDEDAGGGVCAATKASTGGCAYGDDNGPIVQRGTPLTLAVGSCSGSTGAGDNVDEFRSGQHTELVVTQDGREVMRFSSTVRYATSPTEVRLRPGRCVEYKQEWDGCDNAGRPVPAGEYRVVLTVVASGSRYDFEDGTSQRFPPSNNSQTVNARLVD